MLYRKDVLHVGETYLCTYKRGWWIKYLLNLECGLAYDQKNKK